MKPKMKPTKPESHFQEVVAMNTRVSIEELNEYEASLQADLFPEASPEEKMAELEDLWDKAVSNPVEELETAINEVFGVHGWVRTDDRGEVRGNLVWDIDGAAVGVVRYNPFAEQKWLAKSFKNGIPDTYHATAKLAVMALACFKPATPLEILAANNLARTALDELRVWGYYYDRYNSNGTDKFILYKDDRHVGQLMYQPDFKTWAIVKAAQNKEGGYVNHRQAINALIS